MTKDEFDQANVFGTALRRTVGLATSPSRFLEPTLATSG